MFQRSSKFFSIWKIIFLYLTGIDRCFPLYQKCCMELFLYGRKSKFKNSPMTECRLTVADQCTLLFLLHRFFLHYAHMDDITSVQDCLCICSSVLQHDLGSLRCFLELSVRFSSSSPENSRETPQEPVQQSMMSAAISVMLTMARCSHPLSLRSLFFSFDRNLWAVG